MVAAHGDDAGVGYFVEGGGVESWGCDVFVQEHAVALFHLLECMSVVVWRHRHIATVDDLGPVLVPVESVVDIVCPPGLLLRASGADAARAVTRTGLDARGGVEGEADDGYVDLAVVLHVEASFPW